METIWKYFSSNTVPFAFMKLLFLDENVKYGLFFWNSEEIISPPQVRIIHSFIYLVSQSVNKHLGRKFNFWSTEIGPLGATKDM